MYHLGPLKAYICRTHFAAEEQSRIGHARVEAAMPVREQTPGRPAARPLTSTESRERDASAAERAAGRGKPGRAS